MQKLQHLSLINKVTKELDKSLGVNDKTLAEFVVDVAKSSKFDPQTFFRELQKNGAELPEPFANELVGMIERLANKGGGSTAKEGEKKKAVMEKPTKENPFPGLHRPDAEEHGLAALGAVPAESAFTRGVSDTAGRLLLRGRRHLHSRHMRARGRDQRTFAACRPPTHARPAS